MSREVKQFRIKPGEELLVTFPSRGASGLSLLYEGANECISIELLAPTGIKSTPLPGSPLEQTFRIKGLKTGSSTVHFYETRIWEPDFRKITVAEVYVEVQ